MTITEELNDIHFNQYREQILAKGSAKSVPLTLSHSHTHTHTHKFNLYENEAANLRSNMCHICPQLRVEKQPICGLQVRWNIRHTFFWNNFRGMEDFFFHIILLAKYNDIFRDFFLMKCFFAWVLKSFFRNMNWNWAGKNKKNIPRDFNIFCSSVLLNFNWCLFSLHLTWSEGSIQIHFKKLRSSCFLLFQKMMLNQKWNWDRVSNEKPEEK